MVSHEQFGGFGGVGLYYRYLSYWISSSVLHVLQIKSASPAQRRIIRSGWCLESRSFGCVLILLLGKELIWRRARRRIERPQYNLLVTPTTTTFPYI